MFFTVKAQRFCPRSAVERLGLHPWDTAAGVLLVREAGGMVTTFAGQGYRPGDYEILASNGHVHAEVHDAILGVHGQQPKSDS